jgi:hypothetical protein
MTEAELILQKALVGSNLDSSQWNQIQAGFRNRAFFSSRVAEVNILAAMRERVAKYAEGETDLSKIRMMIRDDLRRANYTPEPGQENTIHDLFSQARLDVIIKTNVAQARGYMQYAEGMSPGAFAAFPAQEFTRIAHRRNQRQDWPQRWAKAGGKTYGGKMIALKDDPVWERLSVFGNPFPPFDWGSGMGVMDVDRKTAIQLGLISDEELRGKTAALREKPVPDFNANLQATVPVPNLRRDSLCGQVLIKNFGDQVAIENSVVSWQGNLIQDVIAGRRKKAQLGVGYNGRPLPLSHNFFREHLSKHFGDNETNPQSVPLTTGDYELLPAVWRKPDRVTKSRDRDHLEFETFDGGILHLFVSEQKGIRSYYKTKSGRSLQ